MCVNVALTAQQYRRCQVKNAYVVGLVNTFAITVTIKGPHLFPIVMHLKRTMTIHGFCGILDIRNQWSSDMDIH